MKLKYVNGLCVSDRCPLSLSEKHKWPLQLQNTYRNVLWFKRAMNDVSKLLYCISSVGTRIHIYVQNLYYFILDKFRIPNLLNFLNYLPENKYWTSCHFVLINTVWISSESGSGPHSWITPANKIILKTNLITVMDPYISKLIYFFSQRFPIQEVGWLLCRYLHKRP